MCTVLLAIDLPTEGCLTLAANRDEDFARPSEPPRMLRENPRVLGGRDQLAGGTWSALRTTAPLRLVAILNRLGHPHGNQPSPGPKPLSRGTICLDAAYADSRAALEARLEESVGRSPVSPFSLLVFEEGLARAAYYESGNLRWQDIGPGLHAIAHGDLDDESSERVAYANEQLAGLAPEVIADAGRLRLAMTGILKSHDGARSLCLHGKRYGTVSSAAYSIRFSQGDVSWLSAQGPPCLTPYIDLASLATPSLASPFARNE